MGEISKGAGAVGQTGQGRPGQQGPNFGDKAGSKVQDAVGTAQQTANAATGEVGDKVEELSSEAVPKIAKLGDQAQQLLQQGRQTLGDTTERVRGKVTQASDAALAYTKDEPARALLAAAGTGALLMVLLRMMTRSRD
jgi:ElaB/YqjD/DUF883 family membrane-anchored ribosome-binding protein